MRVRFALALFLWTLVHPAIAGPIPAQPGWRIVDTELSYSKLIERLEAAIAANKMGLVNYASASDGAKAQGFTILGNRVVGVYRNDFARRMLAASIPAGIEAPIRFYIVEAPNNTATLAYKSPTAVFEPYFAAAGSDLRRLAAELDTVFAMIADDATRK